MNFLFNLKDFVKRKKIQRVGRGAASGWGKTAGRGSNGEGSRSGSKKRYTYEGGQQRLFMKTPKRGFSRNRFKKPYLAVNLDYIEKKFKEGETVNLKSFIEKDYVSHDCTRIKILSKGELKKKVIIECDLSQMAKEKLKKNGITYKEVK